MGQGEERPKRGRPPLNYEPVIVQVGDFRLHPTYEPDLIAFFAKVPSGQRQRAIKAAMRAGGLSAIIADLQSDDAELTDAAGGFL